MPLPTLKFTEKKFWEVQRISPTSRRTNQQSRAGWTTCGRWKSSWFLIVSHQACLFKPGMYSQDMQLLLHKTNICVNRWSSCNYFRTIKFIQGPAYCQMLQYHCRCTGNSASAIYASLSAFYFDLIPEQGSQRLQNILVMMIYCRLPLGKRIRIVCTVLPSADTWRQRMRIS